MTEPRNNGGGVSARRRASIVAALLERGSVTGAAAALGLSRQQVHNYLKRPDAWPEFDRARDEMMTLALNGLQARLTAGVDKLTALLECGKPAIEVRAATAIVSLSLRAVELAAFDARLRKIEELLKEEARR